MQFHAQPAKLSQLSHWRYYKTNTQRIALRVLYTRPLGGAMLLRLRQSAVEVPPFSRYSLSHRNVASSFSTNLPVSALLIP